MSAFIESMLARHAVATTLLAADADAEKEIEGFGSYGLVDPTRFPLTLAVSESPIGRKTGARGNAGYVRLAAAAILMHLKAHLNDIVPIDFLAARQVGNPVRQLCGYWRGSLSLSVVCGIQGPLCDLDGQGTRDGITWGSVAWVLSDLDFLRMPAPQRHAPGRCEGCVEALRAVEIAMLQLIWKKQE